MALIGAAAGMRRMSKRVTELSRHRGEQHARATRRDHHRHGASGQAAGGRARRSRLEDRDHREGRARRRHVHRLRVHARPRLWWPAPAWRIWPGAPPTTACGRAPSPWTWPPSAQRKRDIVDSWSASSRKGLEQHETLELMMGQARFSGPKEVTVEPHGGGARVLTAEHIFINVGTRPRTAADPGAGRHRRAGQRVGHGTGRGARPSDRDWRRVHRPRVRADVPALRQPGDRARGARALLPRARTRTSPQAIRAVLEEDGIEILCETKVERVERGPDGQVVVTATRPDGPRRIEGSHVLVAAGRIPNSDTLDPAKAGLAVNERGFITVNDRLETNVPGIFALGDVNGGPAFTHVSYDDFRIVTTNVLRGGQASTDGRLVPYTVFIDPAAGTRGSHRAPGAGAGLRGARGDAADEPRGARHRDGRDARHDEGRGRRQDRTDPGCGHPRHRRGRDRRGPSGGDDGRACPIRPSRTACSRIPRWPSR